ncbi:MAG: oligosaccharide flippase family protein [Patescibacteria group bacterium]
MRDISERNLIAWLGQKVGFDAEYFFKNGFWVTLRYIFITGLGISLSVAFARLASKELYGQYQFIIAFIAFFSFLSLPGLNVVTLREAVHGNMSALRQAVQKSFFWGIGISVISVLYGAYLVLTGGPHLGFALMAGGVIAPFFYAPNNWYVFYEGRLDFRSSTVRIIITQILLFLFMFAGLFFHLSILFLVVFYFAIQAFLNIYFYTEVSKQIEKVSTQVLDMRFALLATFQKFSWSLSESLQIFIIAFLYGFEMLAVFQVAYLLIAAFSGFVGAFSSLYFPLIMKKERVLVGKSLFHNLLLGILGAFAYILFLKLFFLFFYGEAYQQSLQLAYSFSLLVVFIPLRLYIINFFTAHKENVAVIVANIFSNSIALFAFFGFKDFGFEISVLAYMYTLHFSLLFFLGIVYIAPLLKKRIML